MNQSALELQPAPQVYTDEHGSYCLIPLTRGQSVKVDPEDYEWLSQWKWYAKWEKCTSSYYAVRHRDAKIILHMSREIHKSPDGILVDHHNRDSLDNRRLNLRDASHSQNQWNKGKQKNNTSGFKGVSWESKRGMWRASIRANGKGRFLGHFNNPELAAAAYLTAARKLHGEYASS